MYSQCLDSSTAVIIEIDKVFAKIEYIDKMARPDLCGKTKIVKIIDIKENKRFLNSIVTVFFKASTAHGMKFPAISSVE
jgi:hypothetical protein